MRVGPYHLECALKMFGLNGDSRDFSFLAVPPRTWVAKAKAHPHLKHTLLVVLVDELGVTILKQPAL
jgi:hypothetical protein